MGQGPHLSCHDFLRTYAQWKGYAENRDSVEREDGNQKQIPIKTVNKKIQETISKIFHKDA